MHCVAFWTAVNTKQKVGLFLLLFLTTNCVFIAKVTTVKHKCLPIYEWPRVQWCCTSTWYKEVFMRNCSSTMTTDFFKTVLILGLNLFWPWLVVCKVVFVVTLGVPDAGEAVCSWKTVALGVVISVVCVRELGLLGLVSPIPCVPGGDETASVATWWAVVWSWGVLPLDVFVVNKVEAVVGILCSVVVETLEPVNR